MASHQHRRAFYFPVSSPSRLPGPFYELRSGSPGGASYVEVDDERERYLHAKRAAVAMPGRGAVRVSSPQAEAAIATTRKWLQGCLLEEHPQCFSDEALAADDLDELVMRLQEDVVVLARSAQSEAARAPAVYLNVCLPSRWNPERMLGKNFLGLHAHVPSEEGFGKSQRVALAATLFDRPRVRFVWGLSADDELDQHIERRRAVSWESSARGFLRVERQVVVPLHSQPGIASPDVSLFLIRPYLYAFDELSAPQRATLRGEVSGMSEAMRRYKGIAGHEAQVLRLLA